MTIKIPIVWYIVIALALYIVFLKSCSGTKCPVATVTTIVKHDTLSVHDTIPLYVPQPAEVRTKWDTSYLAANHLDTAGIIADYMAKRAYSDTIKNQYGSVYIHDTLYQNKIEDRKATFDFNIPQTTLTNIVKPKNQVFAGLDLGASNFISFGPELILKTKVNKMYWIGASFTSLNQFYYHVGAAWLIHL